MIEARPLAVALNATSLIVFQGNPNTPIVWGVTGNGTLYPLAVVTDDYGVAAGVLYPTGSAGDQITVRVTYAG